MKRARVVDVGDQPSSRTQYAVKFFEWSGERWHPLHNPDYDGQIERFPGKAQLVDIAGPRVHQIAGMAGASRLSGQIDHLRRGIHRFDPQTSLRERHRGSARATANIQNTRAGREVQSVDEAQYARAAFPIDLS